MGGSPPVSPPSGPSGGERRRDELAAAPPFLTWRAIYAIVIGALAVEVVVFAALTAALR